MVQSHLYECELFRRSIPAAIIISHAAELRLNNVKKVSFNSTREKVHINHPIYSQAFIIYFRSKYVLMIA